MEKHALLETYLLSQSCFIWSGSFKKINEICHPDMLKWIFLISIKEWNLLHADVISASCDPAFKNHLKWLLAKLTVVASFIFTHLSFCNCILDMTGLLLEVFVVYYVVTISVYNLFFVISITACS